MSWPRFASTYSIVARCKATGRIGAAVQSHYFAVGATVTRVQEGIGAVVTQSFIEASYTRRGLAALAAGNEPGQVLAALLAEDPLRELRQVALMDAAGRTATHTGPRCVPACGHRAGRGFSVQGNMLTRPEVVDAMATSFERSSGRLETRLLASLESAQAEGGDLRGMMSSAICVTAGDDDDHGLDLRVDHHEQPLHELLRLLHRAEAARHLARALALGPGRDALEELDAAIELAPDQDEYRFWKAVVLIHLERRDRARAILTCEVAEPARWGRLLEGLTAAGLVTLEPSELRGLLLRA